MQNWRPAASAMVDSAISALERIALGLPFRGWCWPNFSNTIIASRLGRRPSRADHHGTATGPSLIASQSRQENFSRTPSRSPSTAGASSPASASRPPRACASDAAAAARADRRRIDHHPLRAADGRGTCRARRAGDEGADRRRLGGCLLRRQFVFRRTGFKFLEVERQLIDQPRRALRLLLVFEPGALRAWRSAASAQR